MQPREPGGQDHRPPVERAVLQKGESRLLVTGRDGARERVLATLPLPEGAHSPAWSPDGKKIAVTHGRGIFLIDAASGAKTSVPLSGWHGSIDGVTWTPGGDALLVSAVDERSGGHTQLLQFRRTVSSSL